MRIGGVRDQIREARVLKLPGIDKEAVVDINSCDAGKIQGAFEEISNYAGSNMDGGVVCYIQHALNTGEHYPFGNKALLGPSISVTTNEGGLNEIKEIKASAWDIMVF